MTNNTTPRGLATLAFLKTRFDEGRDHFALIEPFVADALPHASTESFLPHDIADLIRARRGLDIPADTIRTVLSRFARHGYVRAGGGRYMVTKQVPDPALDSAVSRTENIYQELVSAFTAFARDSGVMLNEDDALSSLAQFISDNKVPLLLDEAIPDSPLDRSSLDRRLTRLVALFINEKCLKSPELRFALQALMEGMVLQDALLLRDLAGLGKRFRSLTVVLDTPVLFSALDMTGLANGLAARETLALVRELGAVTIAFERTIAEMRQILAMYEQKLSTPGGRLSLYQTELTRYIITERLSPSDIRTISVTLEKRLGSIAIPVQDVPTHEPRYTLDEVALAAVLADADTQDMDAPRVRHDVDCIAGVLTLRAGRSSTSIETSRAVFCTTSGRVIKNVQQWYRDQGEHGVPPIVHQQALSSLAWLKRSKAARGVMLHELAAVCAAALRPTRNTWNRFITNIRKLRDDGTLSDDETVAIVASEFTEPFLARLDDDTEPDADTIEQAIDRIREADRQDLEKAMRHAVNEAKTQATLARDSAADAYQRLTAIERMAASRTEKFGKAIGLLVFACGFSIVVGAAALSIPGTWENIGDSWKWIARTVLGAGVILAIYSQVYGPSLNDLRKRLATAVSRWTRALLYGLDEAPRDDQDTIVDEIVDRSNEAQPDGR